MHFLRIPSLRKLLRRSADRRDWVLEWVPKGAICAEIGVYKGEFSDRISRVVQPRELHLIDPWKYEPGEQFKRAWYGGAGGLSQRKMDEIYESVFTHFRQKITEGSVSVHRSASSQAVSQFPDAYFDWVYIDGNHLYDYVKRDLRAYHRKVKDGGIIAGDDFGEQGWWNHGVTRAVCEFVAEGWATPICIRGGQFVLRKDYP